MQRSITDKLGRHVSGWRIKDAGSSGRGGGEVSVRRREKVGRKEEETQSGGRKMRKGDGLPGC